MDTQPPQPSLTNPRFTLELEFVLSLANPYYLSHLAVNFPNLLGTSTVDEEDNNSDSGETTSTSREAQSFHAYLAYLYSYWKTPEYAQFLTHPGATLRALRLLQEDSFRRDIIRPQVIEGLLAGDVDLPAAPDQQTQEEGEEEEEGNELQGT